LPDEVKLRIVETLKETLMKPDNGIMLVGPLKGLWRCELENTESSMKLMSKRKGLFSTTLNSEKRFMNKSAYSPTKRKLEANRQYITWLLELSL
jgi:hypothetical protein